MSNKNLAYKNRVFSYNNIERAQKNYSRKDFSNTKNKLVVFYDCIFISTIFSNSKVEECSFVNCSFKNIEFERVIFDKNTFKKCEFESIFFHNCKYENNQFLECTFEKSVEYPHFNNIIDVNNNEFQHEISLELDKAIDCHRLHKHIRESDTILKKKKQRLSKKVTKQLKKIKKNDRDRLGLTKKQRLAENAKRKKERVALQNQSYQDSQIGKNREVDEAILQFLLGKYTEQELINGFNYSMEHINFKFNSLSYLIKFIDESLIK
ncbi:MAG: pentapeptide repeat-containing protein [Lachnospirales bacterium]